MIEVSRRFCDGSSPPESGNGKCGICIACIRRLGRVRLFATIVSWRRQGRWVNSWGHRPGGGGGGGGVIVISMCLTTARVSELPANTFVASFLRRHVEFCESHTCGIVPRMQNFRRARMHHRSFCAPLHSTCCRKAAGRGGCCSSSTRAPLTCR